MAYSGSHRKKIVDKPDDLAFIRAEMVSELMQELANAVRNCNEREALRLRKAIQELENVKI